jgi:hypothetical protein
MFVSKPKSMVAGVLAAAAGLALFPCRAAAGGFAPGPGVPEGNPARAVPAPPAKAEGGPAALERKLHGAWEGQGPCVGGITFRADKTYERTLHGPGRNNSAGAWEVRWDALPPTLLLTCKTSDDPLYVRKEGWKLTRLDDEALTLTHPGGRTTMRFSRRKKADEKPRTPRAIVEQKFEGTATVEFPVVEVGQVRTGRSPRGDESGPLTVVAKAGGEGGGSVHAEVSWEVATRLKRLGVEDPAEHFRGKVVRVRGRVERLPGRSGPAYRIEVSSLDQIEVIRKP